MSFFKEDSSELFHIFRVEAFYSQRYGMDFSHYLRPYGCIYWLTSISFELCPKVISLAMIPHLLVFILTIAMKKIVFEDHFEIMYVLWKNNANK